MYDVPGMILYTHGIDQIDQIDRASDQDLDVWGQVALVLYLQRTLASLPITAGM